MSIFTKILILFFISITLMFFVSLKTNTLTQKTFLSLLKEKYIQASDELFTYFANNEIQTLDKKIQELNFIKIKNIDLTQYTVLYKNDNELSSIKIVENSDGKYFLYMRYLDDKLLLGDLNQDKYIHEINSINYYILLDIIILVAIFMLILKIIYPLKRISTKLKAFGEGKYTTRVDIDTKDEIGKLSQTFNTMAQNIQALIASRERLLRDIAHELKTPLTKSKLALEMMPESKYKNMLFKTNKEMQRLIHELLHIEKLNANTYSFKHEKFSTETLITESLSKLFIEDEKFIDISILNNTTVEADLYYLSIALKNLIDNALKYTSTKPIQIVAKESKIYVHSQGEKLDKPLEYYCEIFTQKEESRTTEGFGLGLALVKSILDKHALKFYYLHKNDENIFVMHTKKST
ncbi:ArsS family sensor histidine kinase [Sulfurimonas sp.]